MQPPFFEHDPDEIIFNGKTYLDYFNLFPNLHFEPTLELLNSLAAITVLNSAVDAHGWQIAVNFGGVDFLVDTTYHGTSTLFCVAKDAWGTANMLTFLGCFVSVLRDDWK